MRRVAVLMAIITLAACQQAPEAETTQPVPDLAAEDIATETLTEDGLPTTADGTLLLREPDTCGLDKITVPVEGQSPDIVPTLGLERDIRIIAPGDIVTQEYDPHRVNFYLDAAGLIYRISCG